MGDDLEDSAERISGAQDFVDLFFHALLGFGIGAVEQNFLRSRERGFFPRGLGRSR